MKDWVICKIDVTVTRQGFSDTKTSKHLGKMSERTLWFPGQRYSSRERERVNWVFCLARASLLGSVSFTALLWIRHCCPLNVTSSTAQWIWQHKTFTLEHCDVASRQWIRQCCPLNVTSIQLSEFDKTKPVPLGAVHCDVASRGWRLHWKGRRGQFPEWNITASCLRSAQTSLTSTSTSHMYTAQRMWGNFCMQRTKTDEPLFWGG